MCHIYICSNLFSIKKFGIAVFLLYENSLYILDIKLPSDMWFAHDFLLAYIASYSLNCFLKSRSFLLTKSNLFILPIMGHTLSVSKKFLPNPKGCKDVLHMLSNFTPCSSQHLSWQMEVMKATSYTLFTISIKQ